MTAELPYQTMKMRVSWYTSAHPVSREDASGCTQKCSYGLLQYLPFHVQHVFLCYVALLDKCIVYLFASICPVPYSTCII